MPTLREKYCYPLIAGNYEETEVQEDELHLTGYSFSVSLLSLPLCPVFNGR